MKSLLLSPLLVFAVAIASVQGATLTYSDTESLPENQREAINALTEKGYVQGYSDGTYRPTQTVNRAEFLKVLTSASGWEMLTNEDMACFKDFTGQEEWFWKFACAAKKAGVVDGYPDGTFKADRYINIAEGMKIAANTFNIPLPMYFREPDNWYDPYMDAMSGQGVFEGVRREPAKQMTRAEMAFVVSKLTGTVSACGSHFVGETYKVDCNTCSCTESGEICTKMACPVLGDDTKCFSSNDCPSNQRCSTEWGDCQSACAPGAEICPAVCAGTCQVK